MPVSQQAADRVLAEKRRPPKHLKNGKNKQRRQMSRAARLRAHSWEVAGRLAVNLMISSVALATLVRLIPYYQVQRQVLREVETAVAATEKETKLLRADFSRYFDPTQASQIIQESGARQSEQHIPVVLVDPLSQETDIEAGE